jgi:hypothetical protein
LLFFGFVGLLVIIAANVVGGPIPIYTTLNAPQHLFTLLLQDFFQSHEQFLYARKIISMTTL